MKVRLLSLSLVILLSASHACAEFPVVAATNTNSISSTKNHVINLPSGIVSGDLLLAFLSITSSSSHVWPAGWTRIAHSANGGDIRVSIGYRIADGTEGATITVATSANRADASISYRITGDNGSAPEVDSAIATSTTPDPPNNSPSWGVKDTLWIAVQGFNSATATLDTYPSSYTDGQTEGANAPEVSVARRELNAASENPGTFTISTSLAWVAYTVAVEPGAAGADDDLMVIQ